MKYEDPSQVICPDCGKQSHLRVDELLELRARCPGCEAALDHVGLDMRAGLDDWARHMAIVEITMVLEEALGLTLGDDEVLGAKTLDDLARVVATRLPKSIDRQIKSRTLVREAVEKMDWSTSDEPAFDLPLLDAIQPGRWAHRREGNEETALICSFVAMPRRSRMLGFLGKPKHRRKATAELAHFRHFDPRWVVAIPRDQHDPASIERLLRARGAGSTCLVISEDSKLDGHRLPLRLALERVVGRGMGTLLSCTPGMLAYFEGEGPEDRALLVRRAGEKD